MRLSIVTDTFPPDVNGVANTLRRLQVLMRARGHAVEVILPGDLLDAAVGAGMVPADEPSSGLRLAAVPLPGYKGLRIGLPSRSALVKHWRVHRPDVIYVATESLLGFSAVEAAEDSGVCVVSGYHTNFDHYMRDYKLPMLEAIAGGYLRSLHNRTSATFAPSPDAIARLDSLGFENLRLLGRGVDTARFDPAKRSASLRAAWGAGEADTVALYVGRLAPEKNLSLAMAAFAAMAAREAGRGNGFKAVLVGDGPKREELERSAPACCHFAGMQTGEALAAHFASADVFVFPSVTETFGNVIIEAMASGLVTVAYDYAAAKLHIENGVNGLAVPVNDEPAFLAACLGALERRDWPVWRAQARETAGRLSWEAVVDAFERDLVSLASRQPVALV